MGENSTCACNCFKSVRSKYDCLSKYDWCHEWRPPPFPIEYTKDQLQELVQLLKNDKGLKKYQDECGYEIPKISTSVPSTAAAGGTIAGIVILILVIIALVIAVLFYLWKRHKKGTGRYNRNEKEMKCINSLPMEKYENTNYLDSKARANHSWNQSQSQLTTDPNCKSYGSLPPNGAPQYVNAQNRTSGEVRVESPREFDKMNSSVLSETLAYDNENFDRNGEDSPGANSQTPLYDAVDGPVLPNVPVNQTSSINNVSQTDQKQGNGVKLPPIDMAKTSIPDLRSPKKKKPIFLQRKSCPVEGIEDISQDMTGNRKSV